MKFNKRTATVALAALMIVGGASAGVVNYFATSTGSGSVNEAISVTGNNGIDFSTQDGTAPETYQERLALTNNNPDDVVDYTWALTGDNGESYINSGVYQVSEYTTLPDDGDQDKFDAGNVTVEVVPSVDTVKYTVDLPMDMENSNTNDNFDLEVGKDGATQYHVKYNPDFEDRSGDNSEFTAGNSKFGVATYDGSSYDKWNTVDSVEAVKSVSVSQDGLTVNITVANEGTQTFGLRGAFMPSDDGQNDAFSIPSDFQYASPGKYTDSNNEDLVGQELDHEGGTSQNYNFAVEFTEQTGSGSYTVTAQAEP